MGKLYLVSFPFQSKVVCQLGNPYTPLPHTVDRLVFRVLPRLESSSSDVTHPASFSASASTTSEDVGGGVSAEAVDVTVVKRHEVRLRSSVQPEVVWYGGRARGESAMKSTADIGSR